MFPGGGGGVGRIYYHPDILITQFVTNCGHRNVAKIVQVEEVSRLTLYQAET